MADSLFDTLDDVPWSQLQHSYDTAEELPGLLRDLASADRAAADAAFDALFEMVWHPESLSAATPHTIPFVIEIIEKTTSSLRGDLLVLLQEMLSPDDIPDHERELASAVADAIKAGMPIYLNLIRDEALHMEAIDLLSAFPDACDEIAPPLLAMLDEEADPRTQYTLIDTLMTLASKPGACSDRDAYHAALRSINQSDVKALQLAATRALIKGRATAPGDGSFAVVKDSIVSPHDYILPHVEPNVLLANTIRSDSLGLLKRLDTEEAVAALEDILARVQPFTESESGALGDGGVWGFTRSTFRHADAEFGLNVLYLLLQLGLGDDLLVKLDVRTTGYPPSGEVEFNFTLRGDRTPPDWRTLTPLQARVLTLIAATDLLWTFQTNLLSVHGLPSDREALLAWVEARTGR